MQNVKVEKNGNTLVVTVNLDGNRSISKSGKSEIIATTSGNVQVEPGIYLGLNCYTPR